MTNSSLSPHTSAGETVRRRLLGIRIRYWQIGLISTSAYGVALLAINLAKYPGQVGRHASSLLVAALFGSVMAAMFAYFEKKALARLNIDADAAYDENIFRPVQSRTVVLAGNPESTLQSACDALAEYGAIVEKRDDAGKRVEAVTTQNWRSYGERLTISIEGSDPCEATIRASPRIFFLKFASNYGRSWEHVQALATHLETGAFLAPGRNNDAGALVPGDSCGTPPGVMEAGAWQRLLTLTILYSMVLLGLGQPGKTGLVIGGFVVGLSLEFIAFLRFRKQVRNQLRSEFQESAEAMLNNCWPAIFATVMLMDWRPDVVGGQVSIAPVLVLDLPQHWATGNNIAVLIIVGMFIFMAYHRLREKRRERLQHGELQAGREKAELQRQLIEAKLVALSAQIEPHFLFNTLASIQYLIRNDANKAADMTSDLIRYLRLALPRMKQSTARLADELDLVRAYLGIMQIRMGQRLQFAIDEPGVLGEMQVPTMALITLAENAIKHGLEQKPGGGTIHVGVDSMGGDLRLHVADTGGGFSTAASGTGIGLANIRERLGNLYGERASLSLEANQPSGVKAILILPMDRK